MKDHGRIIVCWRLVTVVGVESELVKDCEEG